MDKWGYSYLILAENIVGKEEIARHEVYLWSKGLTRISPLPLFEKINDRTENK